MSKVIDFKTKSVSSEKKELTAIKLSDGRYLLIIKGYTKKIEIVFDDEEKMNSWANRFCRAL